MMAKGNPPCPFPEQPGLVAAVFVLLLSSNGNSDAQTFRDISNIKFNANLVTLLFRFLSE